MPHIRRPPHFSRPTKNQHHRGHGLIQITPYHIRYDILRRMASNVKTVLASLSIVWYCLLWCIGLLGWSTARRRYRNRPRSPTSSAPPESVPGVSILRPLKGLDPNLFENLESTCLLRYPKFEIIFSVSNADDQALNVVHEILERYPKIDAKVIVGEEVVGVNPKVNNLMRPYKVAKYDILWVLDSNVIVDPGTLARSVDALTIQPSSSSRRIGVVHHVPFAYASDRSLGARMEEAFLNTNHAKMYIALNMMAIDSCVTGKSSMYRRSDVERLTADLKPRPITHKSDGTMGVVPPKAGVQKGLAVFGKFLAEDNMIGAAIWHELGMRHDLSCDVAKNAIGKMSFMGYVSRRIRWIRVRKHMVLSATLLEPLTEGVVAGVLAAWGLHRLAGIPPWIFLIMHFSLWFIVDLDVYASLAGHPLTPGEQWPFFCAWALRELCTLPIWAAAVFGSDVEWRGTKYKMSRRGEVRRADDQSSSSGVLAFLSSPFNRKQHYQPLSTLPH